MVDAASMEFILPQTKSVQTQRECRLLLNTPSPIVRHLSRVLGLLESCRSAVIQIKTLQRWSSCNTPVDLTPTAKSDLSWKTSALQAQQESHIVPPIANLTISSDASKQEREAPWDWGLLEQHRISGL